MLATLDPAETVNAVDVGCGSGILAIAMAKLWQRPVSGGDNDAQAVEVAIENAELNGAASLCRFVTSIGLGAPELAQGVPYDLIVANILAGPLVELSKYFAPAVRPGGRVLLSGLLVEQAEMVLYAYKRRGFRLRAAHRPRDRRRLVAHAAAAQAVLIIGPRASCALKIMSAQDARDPMRTTRAPSKEHKKRAGD